MRILIAGVHPVFCEGLATIMQELEKQENIHVLIGDNIFEKLHPDLADWFLLDIGTMHDVAQLDSICKPLVSSGKKVVLFTDALSPARIRDIITLIGVSGVIPKQLSIKLVLIALRLIQIGGRYLPELVLESKTEGFAESQSSYKNDSLEELLTPRQLEVLEEVGKGRSNQQIAHLLNISVATVKLHVNAILQTLGAGNRTEAALMLYKAKEARRARYDEEENAETKTVPLPMPRTPLETAKMAVSVPAFDMND